MSGSTHAPFPGKQIPSDMLKSFVMRVLVKLGMFKAEAEIVADRFLDFDCRGQSDVGSETLPAVITALENGVIDPRGQIQVIKQTAAAALIDGATNFGHLAATRGVLLACELAKSSGTGTVAVTNSTTLGKPGVYAALAAKHGCVAFVTSSAVAATVTSPSSRSAAVGNHCVAWATPDNDAHPACIESNVAPGDWKQIADLSAVGGQLPPAWGLTATGSQTRNPTETTVLLPQGADLGFGLGWFCGAITGPLVGDRMPVIGKRNPNSCNHFISVIDLAAWTTPEKARDELTAAELACRAGIPAAGFTSPEAPGDAAERSVLQSLAHGVTATPALIGAMRIAAKRTSVPLPW